MNPSELGGNNRACSRLIVFLLAVMLLSGGCEGPSEPRLRFGAFFGSPFGMSFPEPAALGNHSYEFSLNETNGMVYTCKGGFIDVAHVREAADRTFYLQEVALRNILDGKRRFSFHAIEPSKYWVTLSYPRAWDDYSKQKKEIVAKDVSIAVGQYLAHTSLIWHEMITWYGFASSGIFPDTISSFSWEDTYSDLLGTRLATEALRDEREQSDEAMTDLIFLELEDLDVQPARVAREAAKRVAGQWYTGGFYFFVNMKRHNFDVGLDDHHITPWLVPGICPNATPKSVYAPGEDLINAYGFDVDIEIEPRVLEESKIYHSIGLAAGNRVRPRIDFPIILAAISKKENGSVAAAAKK